MKKNANPTADAAATDRPKGKLVGAVANAATILRFLRATNGPATVTQITRAVNIYPSTCFNILRTLIQEDFVQFDATAKTYQLSLGLVAFAQGALEHSQELHLLKPRIEALARKHRMMVAIWRKISDDRMMLVSAAESDAPVRIYARVGQRSPLLLGASGRVFAAHSEMSRAALKERFQQLRMARPLEFDTYLEQVDEVRRVGWAIDDGNVSPGTITIAAPVLEVSGSVNFACAAILFNGQYDLQRVGMIAQELKAIGHTLVEAAPSPPTPLLDAPPVARKTRAKVAVEPLPAKQARNARKRPTP